MKWQEFVKDYLTFTRKERIGVLVIVFLIIVIAFIPNFVARSFKSKPQPIDTTWAAELKKLEKKESNSGKDFSKNQHTGDENEGYQYDRRENYSDRKEKKELFYFDPNTLDAEGWEKLGLRDKTIQTIQNYLSKGGHFRKPEDLQKVYGLRQNQYEELVPYVRIESLKEPNKEEINAAIIFKPETQPTKNFSSKYSVIDINTADTTAFIALPGIGSKLAARIVNFREKLGGFYSIEQVGETFGLPDSTFQKIKQYLKLETASVKKININTATIDELKAHPYIRWNLANPIVAYRNEHGPYSNLEDLKKVAVVTEELYIKIAPYLSID